MNLFQYVTLPITTVLLIWSIIQLFSGRQPRITALLSSIIWWAATIAILEPELTIQVASFLGIGRGADLVLYILVISFLLSMFYIYQRFQRMESQITELIRQVALQNGAKLHSSEIRKLQENLDTNP